MGTEAVNDDDDWDTEADFVAEMQAPGSNFDPGAEERAARGAAAVARARARAKAGARARARGADAAAREAVVCLT